MILVTTLQVKIDPENVICQNIETGERKKLSEIKLKYDEDFDEDILPYPWTLPDVEASKAVNDGEIVSADYSFIDKKSIYE